MISCSAWLNVWICSVRFEFMPIWGLYVWKCYVRSESIRMFDKLGPGNSQGNLIGRYRVDDDIPVWWVVRRGPRGRIPKSCSWDSWSTVLRRLCLKYVWLSLSDARSCKGGIRICVYVEVIRVTDPPNNCFSLICIDMNVIKFISYPFILSVLNDSLSVCILCYE